MGSAPDIVDISSDEEDAYDDWISEFLGCIDGEPEGFDDVVVMEELSAPKPAQKKGAPQDDLDSDCLILDEDPDKPVTVVDDKHGGGDGSDDLLIVGEKGQLACRDYPHPRHLCANFPFSSTPHEKYCDLCHCYVCDSPAPCSYWSIGFPSTDHCHSTDKDGRWMALRKSFKLSTAAAAAAPAPAQKSDTSLSMMLPLQNRVSDRHPNPAPRPTLSSKSSTLRPCPAISAATRSTISQRHHPPSVVITCRGQRLDQNVTRSQSLISATQYVQREKRTVGALAAQVMQPQAKFRRVESNRSSLIGNSTKRSQHVFSSHIQAFGAAPQISQDQPVTTFQENMTWQDILKGVAAELGVSDNYSRSSTSAQSPAVSSQPTAFSHLRQKSGSPNVDVYAHSTPPLIRNSSSLGFDCGWLDSNTAAENIAAHGGAEDPQVATRQPTNPVVSKEIHMESFLAPVEEPLPEVGKQPGLPELDPVTQLLYDFDSPWSSTAQV